MVTWMLEEVGLGDFQGFGIVDFGRSRSEVSKNGEQARGSTVFDPEAQTRRELAEVR